MFLSVSLHLRCETLASVYDTRTLIRRMLLSQMPLLTELYEKAMRAEANAKRVVPLFFRDPSPHFARIL